MATSAPGILQGASFLFVIKLSDTRKILHFRRRRNARAVFSAPVLSSSLSLNHTSSTSSSGMSKTYLSKDLGLWHSRSSQQNCLCAVQNSATVITDAEEESVKERARVKKELVELMEKTDGNLTEECLQLISSLEKLNPNPEASKNVNLVEGYFEVVKATLKQKGMADAKKASVFESSFTLGRAAFNAFKPVNQEVIITQTYNHIHADDYVVICPILIKNSEGLEPLEGLIINNAKCEFVDANRLSVAFLSSTLRPLRPENEDELQSWRKIFLDVNPGMDERGYVTINLPGAKASLDHFYLDEELRILKGTGGNIFVVRRLKEPAVSL